MREGKEVSASPLRDLGGFLLLAVAVFAAISLMSYNPLDSSFNTRVEGGVVIVHNFGGVVGSYLADLLMQFFGYVSYLLPLAMLGATWAVVFQPKWGGTSLRLIAFALLMISASMLFSIAEGERNGFPPWGGGVGYWSARALKPLLGTAGAVIVAMAVLAGSLVLGVGFTFSAFVRSLHWVAVMATYVATLSWALLGHARKGIDRLLMRGEREFEKGLKPILREAEPKLPDTAIRIAGREVSRDEPQIDSTPILAEALDLPISVGPMPTQTMPKFHNLEDEGPSDRDEKPARIYELPSLDLLEAPVEQEITFDRNELFENAQTLERKLKDFGVFGKVVEVRPGPVVTMYEFEPAAGIKVNQITRLNDDLSLALKALSVRIEPIPGKAVIGIEVSNRERQIVYLKEILSNEMFSASSSRLTITLGKDIAGSPQTTDFRRMPHLLVAGATGSGKSVAVNCMILSVLYKSTPDEVRMILVDPKMLELSLYDGIPHLLLPVVTDPRKSAASLRWAVSEMERRYRLMADLGVRNIEGYNKKVLKVMNGEDGMDEEKSHEAELPLEPPMIETEAKRAEKHAGKLPYILIVIDELADLMMVSSHEVEESIIRLAQMARAAGIHLLLATQRPSVDVITGVIKANMPARISFQVSSKIDSRTILDANGAELLLGAGDMLYLPPGTSKLQRIHGAFVTDNEVKRVTDFWKAQGRPDYKLEILKMQEEAAEIDVEGGEDNDMYRQALNLVRAYRVASISMIQRKLRIGYNRAARIVERMEEEGLLAPGEVGKPREVIASRLDGM